MRETSFRIVQGQALRVPLGARRDLTGYSLAGEIRTEAGGTLLASPTVTAVDAARGEIVVSLSDAQTEVLDFARARFDVEATLGDDTVRLFEGPVYLLREVTIDSVPPGSYPPGGPTVAYYTEAEVDGLLADYLLESAFDDTADAWISAGPVPSNVHVRGTATTLGTFLGPVLAGEDLFTATSGSRAGIAGFVEYNPSAAGTGTMRGLYGFSRLSGANHNGSRGVGLQGEAWHYGSGTVTTLAGVQSFPNTHASAAGGTITSIHGYYAASSHNSTAVTVTRSVCFFADVGTTAGPITGRAGFLAVEQTGATNNSNLLLGTSTVPSGNWSIYSASTRDSYLAGTLQIGGTAGAPVTVSGSRDGNAALADLLTKLAAMKLITDGTSA